MACFVPTLAQTHQGQERQIFNPYRFREPSVARRQLNRLQQSDVKKHEVCNIDLFS